MTFATVCSGIEAPSVAWPTWEPLWFSEIEPFCSALLSQRYPGVLNYGDFTKIQEARVPDILAGGTPCQSFSAAGKRAGLDDPRGVLAFEYIRLARRLGVRWLVFENVEGLLSSNGGKDFGAFLGALAHCGYGFAYRVFDAQYERLAQRRRRLFLVGYQGDWRPPAAVLFERESLRRDTSPREQAEAATARASRSDAAGEGISYAFNSKGGTGRHDASAEMYVNCDARTKVDTLARPLKSDTGSGGRGCILSFDAKQSGNDLGELSPTLRAATPHDKSHANGGGGVAIAEAANVRRLTPREWERLQGFPDDYTLVNYRGKPAKDGPRYKAIGNSIPVPVLAWIGRRIELVEQILREGAPHGTIAPNG